MLLQLNIKLDFQINLFQKRLLLITWELIVITILVFYLARKKTPKKIEIAKKELDNSIVLYENEYGKLLIDKEKLY